MAETDRLQGMIMAGGGGTRFWPRSRAARPKQFLALVGDGRRSLLQQAADRLEPLLGPNRLWVVTGASMAAQVAAQLPDLSPDRLVGEPVGRDTAACIGVGAALMAAVDPDALMVVTPADHVIEPAALFQRLIHAGVQLLLEHPQALITLGIVPVHPATGYGYIQRGASLPGRSGLAAYRIAAFKEKPDRATAQRYLDAGDYFWNSGIFLWKAATILAEIARLRPELHVAVQRIAAAWHSPRRQAVFAAEYASLPRISIDFAVMEHCREGIVIPAPFQWDDVGSWPALERHFPPDAAGNTVLGTQAINLGGQRNLVIGDGTPGQLIATVGVNDLLIVRDGECVLVADRRDEASIKRLVEHLKERGLDQYL